MKIRAISIRTKTNAGNQTRCTKKVSDWGPLVPSKILTVRRTRALESGRELIFSREPYGDIVLETAEITTTLKNIARRLDMHVRITAHSARKGAAVSALLHGVPITLIQAFGAWKSLESLQYYIGKAVRERLCWLDILHETPDNIHN